MLTSDEVIDVTADLWKRHSSELPELDRIYKFLRGKAGIPSTPESAGEELEDLARLSVTNVLSLVVNSFAQSLSVTGFRSPDSDADDAAWDIWQRQKMDARQSEVVRPALTYGASYVFVPAVDGKAVFRPRTPRQAFAAYADPHLDDWPVYALETWLDKSETRARRLGVLYDDEHMYDVDFGYVSQVDPDTASSARRRLSKPVVGEARLHGSDVCPVVRFVNDRDAEDLVVGEVEPLITQQRAINVVNFDRLCVSRFGAFPQKYAVGWDPTREEAVKAAVSRIIAFADDFVKPGTFQSASVEPYNSILKDMRQDVALTAQLPVRLVTGDLVNLSGEALAAADSMAQRKLAGKRESFGESYEQMLRRGAAIEGVEVSDTAEVTWRTTEIQSYEGVVDGISKLSAAGVAIETLVDDVPGWSQQRADAARNSIRRQQGRGVLDALTAAAERATSANPVNE